MLLDNFCSSPRKQIQIEFFFLIQKELGYKFKSHQKFQYFLIKLIKQDNNGSLHSIGINKICELLLQKRNTKKITIQASCLTIFFLSSKKKNPNFLNVF